MVQDTPVSRQRVPILDLSTLEDRTRPARQVSGWTTIPVRSMKWTDRPAELGSLSVRARQTNRSMLAGRVGQAEARRS